MKTRKKLLYQYNDEDRIINGLPDGSITPDIYNIIEPERGTIIDANGV